MCLVEPTIPNLIVSSKPLAPLMKAGALIDTKNFNEVIDAITQLIEEAFPENEESEDEDIEVEEEEKN